MSGTFNLQDFLRGRVRHGTIQVPGAPPIGVRELGALERFKILAEHEDEHMAIMAMEQDAILAVERIRAGQGTADDRMLLARFNSVAAPYHAALISAITIDPHLEPQEVLELMGALNDAELQDLINQAAAYFTGPDLEELKKKNGGQS